MDAAERLRKATVEAVERQARPRLVRPQPGRPQPGRPQPVCPGDVLAFDETVAAGVFWAVIETGGDSCVTLPLDMHPLVGSADVAVPPGSTFGACCLRCAEGLHLASPRAAAARRVGVLTEDIVERARQLHGALAAGGSGADGPARDVDDDLEYRDWLEEVARARSAMQAPALDSGTVVRPRRWHLAAGEVYRLAACFLLAVALGSAGGWTVQRGRVAELEERLTDAEGPRSNVSTVYLFPEDAVRDPAEDTELHVPSAVERVVLSIDTETPYPSYRVRVLSRATGEEIWTSPALQRLKNRAVSFSLPARMLPPGVYRVVLSGLAAGREEQLGEAAMRVRWDDD